MDRGLGGQVPGPGVEHTHHAALPAKGMGIQRACLEGSRSGLQEPVGEAVLRRTSHRAQCRGERQGDENVRDREEQRPLLFQPACGRCLLALRARPILTRTIAVRQCSARRTLGERPAPRRGSAGLDGLHGGQGTRAHAVGDLRARGRAMPPDEVGARNQSSLPGR